METMDLVSVAWLAGLLEGEAWFGFEAVYPSGRRVPIVQLRMTDKDVVERAAHMMGVSVRTESPPPNGLKQMYRARVKGSPAIRLMREIEPFMGERRTEKIRELSK